jgi:TonB family protein
MKSPWLAVLPLLLAAPRAAACAAAQGSASQRVDRAFAQLNAHQPDSAAALLRPVADSGVRATPAERGAAWLLGVIDFYDGRDGDSAAARDFRRALALAPGLRGDWLARVDSQLGAIWRSERGHALCGTLPFPRLATPGDAVPVREGQPKILSGPIPHYPEGAREAHITGRVLMIGVVDTTGRVERGSIKVLTTAHETLSRSAVSYFEGAKFEPARIGGQAVRTCVEVPVDFRLAY